MKRFNKIYLEISNVCNLACAFCPGTKRQPRAISKEELELILPKIEPYTDYLYFHLMGEPLCHPQLAEFLDMAHGFKVILTTNGTLLREQKEMLLASPSLHKVNVSLHAFEANDLHIPFSEYLEGCFEFGKAAEGEKIVVYRLWNGGGDDKRNDEILKVMKEYFKEPWVNDRKGIRIGKKVFLEYGDKFDWPSLEADEHTGRMFCYGLRDQIGILADGTVVPCCLDHDGDIALGNIFENDLEEILETDRTQAIINGFQQFKAAEQLCRRCGYAHVKFK